MDNKQKILFVDDEPMILQGLQRMLRNMRQEWEMSFVQSGPEALELLERQPVDVVVTDMRMPMMDGAQLLDQIKQKYPHVIRIILSGHSDQELIIQTTRPAHQYLSKPCDPEYLKSTITRATNLHQYIRKPELQQLVTQMDSLPSLPELYEKIIEELQSSDPSIKKVGQIIGQDVGMSVKILQLVNSAFFGLPRHIASPEQAVHLLGLETIKSLVLSVHIFSQFENRQNTGFSIHMLWEHSLSTGRLSKKIMSTLSDDPRMHDNSFIAGMLHDVGRLILVMQNSIDYQKIVRRAINERAFLQDIERDMLNTTHAEVGAYLLALWGFPDDIVEAIAFHHYPSRTNHLTMLPVTAVHIANVLDYERKDVHAISKPASFDQPYLQGVHLTDRISEWRALGQD